MPARTNIPAQRPLITEIRLLPMQQSGNADRASVLKRFATLFAQ
ncbi:ABC transporter substrate-binding protein|nr:ABC transporter substrate-binding protein [Candidatus Pantoea persica]